jgi:hypothetical protein
MTSQQGTGRQRLYALVRAQALEPRVPHSIGFPRDADPEADQTSLPWPDVVVIDEVSIGNVFLYRLTDRGDMAGDTWHQSVEDAVEQAAFEYGSLIGTWSTIPEGVDDGLDFATRAAAATRST